MDVEKDNYRLLIVDDNVDIHQDFLKILQQDDVKKDKTSAIDEMETYLFGFQEVEGFPHYEIESAHQGEEALKKVEGSLAQKKPYALIFMDVLMPPGWDGVQTSKRIWEIDPDVHIVICTAYADYSWDEFIKQLGVRDNFLILKKPFENVEIRQMACCLTKKWNLTRKEGFQFDRLQQEILKETEKLKQMFAKNNRSI